MVKITTYDERLSKVCMNMSCNNKCTEMYIMLMGTQKIVHYFCEEHYKQFIEEVFPDGLD